MHPKSTAKLKMIIFIFFISSNHTQMYSITELHYSLFIIKHLLNHWFKHFNPQMCLNSKLKVKSDMPKVSGAVRRINPLFLVNDKSYPSDSRISDLGGAEWFSSWPWNSGPALHPQQDPGGCMGVRPTSLHVLWGLGESVLPCPSGSPVGGAPGVWSAGPLDRGCSVSVWPVSEFGPHCRQ